MSGLYFRHASGKRTPLLPTPARATRSQAVLEDVNFETTRGLSKSITGQTIQPKQPRRGRPRHRAASPSTSEESGPEFQQQDDDEDESDGENISDEEEPAILAPSHVALGRETGPRQYGDSSLQISPLKYEDNLFGDSDDDDDEIYRKVDEISDYEEDEDEREDEHDLEELWTAEDDPDVILDQLDDNSVFGFGADYDSGEDLIALTSDSDGGREPEAQRRVHFSSDHNRPRLLTGSLSPLLIRGLLPSALEDVPEIGMGLVEHAMGPQRRSRTNTVSEPYIDDPYDTDATVEKLPPEAYNARPAVLQQEFDSDVTALAQSPPRSSKSKKGKKKTKAPRPKGPRTGTFIVDQDKPWGILDASGKRVVMLPAPDSQRHDWLDARLQQDYDALSNATPGQLLDDSEGSVTSSQEVIETPIDGKKADIMLASLNSSINGIGERGQATGPSEAFYPPPGFQIAGDYVISPEGLAELGDTFSDVSNEADIPLNIDDIIAYDEDTSDDDESPSSPIVTINMPPMRELAGFGNFNDEFPHLNNRNVTAFRRNADQAHAVLNTTPTFSNFNNPEVPSPRTPAAGHKRKASGLPYQSPVYQGVTPVQRHVWHPTKRVKTSDEATSR